MALSELQTPIPGEITREELRTTAAEHEWGEASITHLETDGYWALEYRIPVDNEFIDHIKLHIDSTEAINGNPVNNVYIRGEAVPIHEYGAFEPIQRNIEDNENVFVDLHTSEGDWTRLTASNHDITTETGIPYEDVFNTITENGITFTATMTYLNSTTEISITELLEAVNTITTTYNDFETHTK